MIEEYIAGRNIMSYTVNGRSMFVTFEDGTVEEYTNNRPNQRVVLENMRNYYSSLPSKDESYKNKVLCDVIGTLTLIFGASLFKTVTFEELEQRGLEALFACLCVLAAGGFNIVARDHGKKEKLAAKFDLFFNNEELLNSDKNVQDLTVNDIVKMDIKELKERVELMNKEMTLRK